LAVKADTSIVDALRLDTSNFGMLNIGRGNTDASQATISVLILNLLDFFTAERNVTQLEDCVEIIATDYYWLLQAEFKIFTLRCKKGQYGPDYGRLSPQRLLMWLEEFSQECRFERAGVQLQPTVASEGVSVVKGFDGRHLFVEIRRQLVLQAERDAAAKVRQQNENIRKYRNQLLERWHILEKQKAVNESKKCTNEFGKG
jgi:hypothetical protein